MRRFTREIKLNDPDAVVNMEYDKLKVNGKRYTWSDAIHAVIDTQDNKVSIYGRLVHLDQLGSTLFPGAFRPELVGRFVSP